MWIFQPLRDVRQETCGRRRQRRGIVSRAPAEAPFIHARPRSRRSTYQLRNVAWNMLSTAEHNSSACNEVGSRRIVGHLQTVT